MDDLLHDIEAFCRTHHIKDSRFGRDAANDTTLLADLKAGREPRRKTVARIRRFMAEYRPADSQVAA
jgi:hypothetical protein